MPYVKQEKRQQLDKLVELIKEKNLTYLDIDELLFSYFYRHLVPSYNNYKNYCGELDQCAIEIKRRNKISIFEKLFWRIRGFASIGPLFEGREKEIVEIHKYMLKINIVADGDLNYILFKLYKYTFKDTILFCNMLYKVKKSIEKLLLARYEEIKIIENGDV